MKPQSGVLQIDSQHEDDLLLSCIIMIYEIYHIYQNVSGHWISKPVVGEGQVVGKHVASLAITFSSFGIFRYFYMNLKGLSGSPHRVANMLSSSSF
jgi:hypothetical protein